MRKMIVLVLGGLIIAGFALGITGCGSKEEVMAEPVDDTGIIEETEAISHGDVELYDQPEDIVYIETHQFGEIHFDFDQYRIRPVDEAVLEDAAGWLKDNAGVRMLIEGHCDERGTNEYNMALGEQRALAARRYLIGLGIAAERISTISYGEERPLDPRSTEDAWGKNRRGHFVISE